MIDGAGRLTISSPSLAPIATGSRLTQSLPNHGSTEAQHDLAGLQTPWPVTRRRKRAGRERVFAACRVLGPMPSRRKKRTTRCEVGVAALCALAAGCSLPFAGEPARLACVMCAGCRPRVGRKAGVHGDRIPCEAFTARCVGKHRFLVGEEWMRILAGFDTMICICVEMKRKLGRENREERIGCLDGISNSGLGVVARLG